MRTVALYTSKGGTGKSTVAANLAAALAARGRRVLVLEASSRREPVVTYAPASAAAAAFRALAEEVEE